MPVFGRGSRGIDVLTGSLPWSEAADIMLPMSVPATCRCLACRGRRPGPAHSRREGVSAAAHPGAGGEAGRDHRRAAAHEGAPGRGRPRRGAHPRRSVGGPPPAHTARPRRITSRTHVAASTERRRRCQWLIAINNVAVHCPVGRSCVPPLDVLLRSWSLLAHGVGSFDPDAYHRMC